MPKWILVRPGMYRVEPDSATDCRVAKRDVDAASQDGDGDDQRAMAANAKRAGGNVYPRGVGTMHLVDGCVGKA